MVCYTCSYATDCPYNEDHGEPDEGTCCDLSNDCYDPNVNKTNPDAACRNKISVKRMFEDGVLVRSEFDEHLGCANWPNCDSEGCGYD